MSLELYNDILNLAREQLNVDLLVKIWHDSVLMNKKDMIEINKKLISFLPYLRQRLNLSSSDSKDFKEFIEEYDEHQYKSQCSGEPNKCLVFFAKKGDLRNVRKAIKKGKYNQVPSVALRSAAKYGRKNIIDYILLNIENVSDTIYKRYLLAGLEGAAEGGNVNLINFFLKKGASVTPRVLYAAAKNGSPEVLNLFDYTTKEDKEAGLEGAAAGGHLELVKKFLEDDTDSQVLEEAIENSAKKVTFQC